MDNKKQKTDNKKQKTWMDLPKEKLQELLNVTACMYSARHSDN